MSFSESSSTAIIPNPSKSTFTMPMSAQSSLSHCTTTRPGIVAGSSGTTESSCPWHTPMPPQILYLDAEFEEFADFWMADIETGVMEVAFERVVLVLVFPRADQAR